MLNARTTILAFLSALFLSPHAARAQTPDLAAAIKTLGAAPCATGALTCVTLQVPLDHRANDPAKTIAITYAISLAAEPSKGTLIYVVGGPGASGLGVADDYLTAFDESLTANMDVVFFDQRGIGPDHGIECPTAQAVFDTAGLPLDTPQPTIDAAKTFVTGCMAELKHPEMLPVVDTPQAIRDLELFRQAIGAPKVWIYGESYGTQFAQEYARAFPAAIKGVILDGVVDQNLGFEGFYATYTAASERILTRVLAACDTVPGCRQDMGGDAAPVLDHLSAQLAQAPIELDLPLGDGTTAKRALTSGMVDANAFYALYGSDDRAVFLRALAAASRGDLLPMLRLGYVNLAIDPATGDPVPDPTWFGAAYYAVTCTDYADPDPGPGPDPDAKAAQILAEATAFAPSAPRLLRSYYVERLACAYWPHQGPTTRPEPFAGGDYPTLILNGDTDPITPVSMAYSVLDNVQNGYMVVMQGGHHVIWGRGFACPDQIVSNLLYDGTLPAAQVQLCSQDFIEGYEPLTMLTPDAAADPFLLAKSLETEVYQSAPLNSWDGAEPDSIGCDHGGTVTVSAEDTGTRYAFAACAWWPGVVIDGTGLLVEDGGPEDGMTLDLAVSGQHQGRITYHNNTPTEAAWLTGTYDAKPVTTPRPLP